MVNKSCANCGHLKSQHIREEGPCRPGHECFMKCQKFQEEDPAQQAAKDIFNRRSQIKEDFCRVYLAHLADGNRVDFRKIEMVEQWSEDRLTVKWFFQERK